MRKRLLIALKPGVLTDEQLARIAALAPDHDILVTRDRAELEAALPGTEIVFGPFPTDLVPKAPDLRWFQQWGAGADWLMNYPDVVDGPLQVTNASGVHAVPISEHILALMLGLARNLPAAFRNQAAATWPPRAPQVSELAGRTAVVVGLGQIGARTAHLLHALGMEVLGVRRHREAPLPSGVARLGSLPELLPLADHLILTVPLTPETAGMIGDAELRAMRNSAYLINIGRGGTVDEPALVRALESGAIAGAGLDVFEEEPLPASSPLWRMEQVIITSHYAGATPEYARRAFEIFSDNLERYISGGPLENLVDKAAGY